MSKIPIIPARKLIKVLHKLGFIKIRQKGSHKFFYREKDNKATAVPVHNQDLAKGLLKKILNEINISVDELIKLLRK